MKKSIITVCFAVAMFAGFTAFAQNPGAPQYDCDNAPCNTQQPCVTPQDAPAYCYTPMMGCGYENCYEPALVSRYAELAGKYRNLGPNDRWSEIYNGNNEVQELQQLDNHFAANYNPQGLTPEQLLQLRTAQGTVKR